MSILATLGRIAAEFTAARVRYATQRQIESLSPELRKDIGWPDSIAAGRTRLARRYH